MADVLRQKREDTEKALQSHAQAVESVEERKKRLQAQRDLLVKQKQEKRAKELGEFQEKTNTGNKEDLHRELLEIDKKSQAKALAKKQNAMQQESESSVGMSEDDRRKAMYKNMRDELIREDNKAKSDHQKQKLEELSAKVQQMDKAKQEKADRERQQEYEEQ